MRGRGPSGPADFPLPLLTGDPVPSTGLIVSSLPDDGRSQVLQKMEKLKAAIVLLVHPDIEWPGCALGGGLGGKNFGDRFFPCIGQGAIDLEGRCVSCV